MHKNGKGVGKLSKSMERAFSKLTVEWQSASRLGETRGTLNALRKRGLAERRSLGGASFSGFGTTQTEYRLKARLL